MTKYKLDYELLEYIQTIQFRIDYVKFNLMTDKEFTSRKGWEEYSMYDVMANLGDVYIRNNDNDINIVIWNDDYTRMYDRIAVTIPISILMGDISELDTWLVEYAKGNLDE